MMDKQKWTDKFTDWLPLMPLVIFTGPFILVFALLFGAIAGGIISAVLGQWAFWPAAVIGFIIFIGYIKAGFDYLFGSTTEPQESKRYNSYRIVKRTKKSQR